MMKLGSTRVQSGRTLPDPQPKVHFKHFSEKPRNLVRVNPLWPSSNVVNRSLIISSALQSEYKTTKIKDVEEDKRNGNLSHLIDFQQRKPRCLCLHGFRTNGDILKKQIQRWPESVHNKIDFVFVDAPFPAEGKSDVEGMFDPPFYEWFQFDKDFMEYRNFYECLAYLENCMLKHGPIDGVLGFSLGAILSAALPGLQASGVALTKVPKLKFQILIAGGKFPAPTVVAEKAFSSPIECPTLHIFGISASPTNLYNSYRCMSEQFIRASVAQQSFLSVWKLWHRTYATSSFQPPHIFCKQFGDTDLTMKTHSIKLLESFVDPFVIQHKRGHIIPRLDEKALEIMLKFLDKIQCNLSSCNGLNISLGTEMRESYME